MNYGACAPCPAVTKDTPQERVNECDAIVRSGWCCGVFEEWQVMDAMDAEDVQGRTRANVIGLLDVARRRELAFKKIMRAVNNRYYD